MPSASLPSPAVVRRPRRLLLLILPLLVALPGLLLAPGLAPEARAEWKSGPANVPIDRLVSNLEQRLAKDPDDAAAHYVLGRVHSLAWARGGTEVPVEAPPAGDAQALPGFAPWDTVRAPKPAEEVDAPRLQHYRKSIVHYRRSTSPPRSAPATKRSPRGSTRRSSRRGRRRPPRSGPPSPVPTGSSPPAARRPPRR